MGSKESGRRPKYSPEVHERIVQHLRIGAFKTQAAAAAGISADTLDNWVLRGNAGEEPYVQFALDVEQVIAEEVIRNLGAIAKAATTKTDGDWRAAAWLLERKLPNLYGPRAFDLAYLRQQGQNGEDGVYSPWKDPPVRRGKPPAEPPMRLPPPVTRGGRLDS